MEYLIGVDESGMGSVFGPLVVAAAAKRNDWSHVDVKDSKRLSAGKRRRLAAEIQQQMAVATATVDALMINRVGIAESQRMAEEYVTSQLVCWLTKWHSLYGEGECSFRFAFDGQHRIGDSIVIDGCTHPMACRPRADRDVFEVSAASIVAKCVHDQAIEDLVASDPSLDRYLVRKHKGYGTPDHREAIVAHGLSDHHRVQHCESLVRNWQQKHKTQAQEQHHGHPLPQKVQPHHFAPSQGG